MITLPDNLIAQKNKKNQADPWLVTLDVTLPDRTTKFHYVNNTEDLVLSAGYDAAGCVGYWKLNDDEADTVVVDSSPNGNNGVLGGGDNTADITVAGKIGTALNFDGAADFVQIPDSAALSPTSEVTVSCWIDSNTPGETTGIVWKHNYSYILIQTEDEIRFVIWDSTETPSSAGFNEADLLAGFNHIVGTFKDGVSKIYLNGVLKDTGSTINPDIRDLAGDLLIGRRGIPLGEYFFDGKIDNVMIFNRALSQAEIAFLYNDGDGIETVPVTYTAINFEIDPIKKTSDKHSPTTKLRVSNINRFLVPYLRSQDITDGTTIDVKAITTAYKGENYTELTLEFDVLACEVDANWVTFTLGGPALLTAPCPDYKYIAQHCRWRFEEIECDYSRKTVADVTLNATDPVSIEVTAHGFATGDSIRLAGIAGITPDMAGNYTITRTDADNFTLNDTDSSDYSDSYTSGGTAGYATCPRTLSDCRDRENEDRFGAFAGIRSGTIQVVG